MDIRFDSLFTPPQLKFLADTVQIGTDAYALLTQNADSPFSHLYMRPEGTRIRTKLMQMQVALGAASPQCPFAFSERHFAGGQVIPQLENNDVLLHIAFRRNRHELPPRAKYKVDLSERNSPFQRQFQMFGDHTLTLGTQKLFAFLIFGGEEQPFATILLPEAGYGGIADEIELPLLKDLTPKPKEIVRRTVALRDEYLRGKKEG